MSAKSKVMERIKGHDLYKLLGVEVDADEKAIKKAYRKRALKCHPDKNPDNPKAAEEFHLLSDAYEVLTNEETKKAYDNVLKARKAAELRNRKMDAERRRQKDDLEARERAAESAKKMKTGEARLAEEMERLQAEGRRLLEEEQEAMRREILENRKRLAEEEGTTNLKVKWKKSGEDPVYDAAKLRGIFAKYGVVKEVVVLAGKKGKMSGLVEMARRRGAEAAAKYETGLMAAPLKVSLMGGKGQEQEAQAPAQPELPSSNLLTDTDFESVVMMRLRQEEARKREIQRIMEEDAREAAAQANKN